MSDFSLWFATGIQHILDLNGYDHICYIAALTVMYPLYEWKKLLVLVTAFTIGHSLTLALSVTNVISPPQKVIECLIPLTIIVTCLYNIKNRKNPPKRVSPAYILALTFGFIHGMGFSYLLKSLLGREENLIGPLFSFNTGLEVGQLVIVLCVLLISVILQRFTKLERKYYSLVVSSAVCVIATALLIQRINEF
ncbi:MAG: HupE/UreJ family protein [Bacteroidia bacterium]